MRVSRHWKNEAHGAGGVGGLLSVTVLTKSTASTYLTTYDANGNVTEYVSINGTRAAHYEYNPYGGLISSTGSMADDFSFRFSTKYFDAETDLLYYGYRYYSSELGRWLNRDPIEEKGGVNLYSFCENNVFNLIDVNGLLSVSEPSITIPNPLVVIVVAVVDAVVDGFGVCAPWNEGEQSKELESLVCVQKCCA